MRDIVIYLNGERGLATLEGIVARGHGVGVAVLPESLAGSEIAERAAKAGPEVWTAANVNDPAFVTRVAALVPRLGVIAGFSTIFKAPLIETPALGTVNLHAGRLPQYRGGSPLNWQIINGETTAGISVIRIDEGIDTGPVLAETTFEIAADDTIQELHAKANRQFPGLVADVLDGFDNGTLIERPQDDAEAHYWRQRKPEDGRIDWREMTARQVYDLVRAVTRPYPGAFTDWQGATVRIYGVRLANGGAGGAPGQVQDADGGPVVACREGAVLLADYEIDGDALPAIEEGTRLGDAPS